MCYRCGVMGHKSTYCQEEQIGEEKLNQIKAHFQQNSSSQINVTCFCCHQKGHYANLCPFKEIIKQEQTKGDQLEFLANLVPQNVINDAATKNDVDASRTKESDFITTIGPSPPLRNLPVLQSEIKDAMLTISN